MTKKDRRNMARTKKADRKARIKRTRGKGEREAWALEVGLARAADRGQAILLSEGVYLS